MSNLVPHRKEGDLATYRIKRNRYIMTALGELQDIEEEVDLTHEKRTTIFKPAPVVTTPSVEEINADYQLQFQRQQAQQFKGDYQSFLHLRFRPGSPEYRAEQARYETYAQLGRELAAREQETSVTQSGLAPSQTLEGETSVGVDSVEGTRPSSIAPTAPLKVGDR